MRLSPLSEAGSGVNNPRLLEIRTADASRQIGRLIAGAVNRMGSGGKYELSGHASETEGWDTEYRVMLDFAPKYN